MKTDKLENLHACKEAIDFCKKFKTSKEAWEACPRGDWMLWIVSKLGIDKRLLTLAKGKCAETVIHLLKDQRSRDAVKAAIDYGNGIINDDQLSIAAAAAYAANAAANAAAYNAAYAAYDAANAAAYNAAYAAYDAAYAAAYDAAYAAAYDAANAAAYNAAYAAYDAAKKENQLKTANICREILTKEVLKAYKKFNL